MQVALLPHTTLRILLIRTPFVFFFLIGNAVLEERQGEGGGRRRRCIRERGMPGRLAALTPDGPGNGGALVAGEAMQVLWRRTGRGVSTL